MYILDDKPGLGLKTSGQALGVVDKLTSSPMDAAWIAGAPLDADFPEETGTLLADLCAACGLPV
jgi:hypothetical protein